MISYFRFSLVFFILITSLASAQDFQIEQPVRYLALGDSYTIGQGVSQSARWPVQLFDSLEQRGFQTESIRIIAQTGWRTDNLRAAMNAANLDSTYNLVSLLIGVNNQFQGRTVASYIPEFELMLNTAIGLAGGKKERVFVLSIPDYAFTPYGEGRSNPPAISADIDSFNVANKTICDQYGIRYYDITPISRRGLNEPNLVAGDGLHPSGLMYTEWVEKILNDVVPVTTSLNQRMLPGSSLFFEGPLLKILSDKPVALRIWDLNGRQIVKRNIISDMEMHWSFPRGTYVYELRSKREYRRGKLIK